MIREDARQPWELNARHLVERLGSEERGRQELATNRKHVVERCVHARAGIAMRVDTDAEGSGNGGGDVVHERHLSAGGEVRRRERGTPRSSRSGAALAARSASCPSNGSPRRVREKMSKCRARGPSRLVEIDDALLGGNEHRERSDRLRDRCQSRPSERCRRASRPSPPGSTTPTAANATGQSSIWRSACTPRDTSAAMERRHHLGDWSVRADSRLLARGRRRRQSARLGNSGEPAGRLASARGHLRPDARSASSSSAPRSRSAGTSLEHVVRTRVYLTDRRRLRRLRARPREGLRRRQACQHDRPRRSLRPAWKVEIEVEAVLP